MWLLYPIVVLLLMYCTLILWYRRAWLDLPEDDSDNLVPDKFTTTVTLIVPARNESSNIKNCIYSIINQTYPTSLLEVLIMDDASEDNTAVIASLLSQQYPHIKVISLADDPLIKANKKAAIETGIKLATGELIVTTDADCVAPSAWLESLVRSYEQQHKKFVAAPVIFYTKPSLLSVFQTLDFLSLQGITGASVHRNFHTMCNGANIAYSKKAFYEVNGFAGIDHLPTGDDMLLMHKIFTRYPNDITWIKNKNALVLTDEAPTWKGFFQQRIRWASKASFYDDKRIFYVLLLVYVFNASLLVLGIASFFSVKLFYWWLLIVALKTITELYFLLPVAAFFNKQKWLWAFPLLQPLHILYTVIAGWLGKFGSYEWKGRRIG